MPTIKKKYWQNDISCDMGSAASAPISIDKQISKRAPSELFSESAKSVIITEKAQDSVSENSLEEILEIVRENFECLRSAGDVAGEEVFESLDTIYKVYYKVHKERDKRKRVGDYLAERGMAEVFGKLLDAFVLHGILETDKAVAFKNFNLLLRLMWNYSDSCAKLCQTLIPAGAIRRVVDLLKDPQLDVSLLKSTAKRMVVKALFGIVHNHLRHCAQDRAAYRQLEAIPTFSKYLKSSFYIIMCKALINLAYILNEDESEQLAASSGNIKFLVGMVEDALKQSSHVGKTYAFSAQETVEAIQHLAANDTNKLSLVEKGILPHLVTMLGEDCEVEEQETASKALWILAFNPSNTLPIQSEPGCLDALHRLKVDGKSGTLKQNCAGALWEIESKEIQHSQPATPALGHIMISYQWDVQQRMVLVKDKLKELGFKVWMDVENMGGDILGAMADAVEKAECILVCLSHRYKDSPSCRTEATYAFKLDKPIVPLMVEPEYQANGWLGALLGTTLYLPYNSPAQLDGLMPSLLRELNNRGCGAGETETDGGQGGPTGQGKARTPQWTPEEVQSWLDENGLSPLKGQMSGWDGDLLWQLKKLSQRAPEYYHQTIESKLKLNDLVTILKFNKALDKLT